MTTYQKNMTEEKTMEEYEAAHTNYFGNSHLDEDSLEEALNDFFQHQEL